MSDFIYLSDLNRCPKCFVRWQASQNKPCHNCGVKLFVSGPPQDADVMELETGMRNWWAWDSHRGWVHRDHWVVEGAKPLIRHYEVPKLDKDYGKHTTPEAVRAGKAQTKRFKTKEKRGKIKPSFKKVYA
jgi:hypothetical protein